MRVRRSAGAGARVCGGVGLRVRGHGFDGLRGQD